MKKKLVVLSGFILGLAPVAVFAQGTSSDVVGGTSFTASCGDADIVSGGNIAYLICTFQAILRWIIPVVVVLGLVYFVWGVASYVIGNDEEAKKKGRDRMIYGIIGLAVIVALWGLVNILIGTFNLRGNERRSIPTVLIP
ncbi:MAG: pilin [Patescibacteria group bacterium]